ncbi:Oidioi.mRNA.OKI2018_I69.XSR.g13425.t1.cds [Oikopleura dioica]|uniref:Oidioi.mRNA.OKI2018_I69.XSR.g13425.t1.cds n=1 Tax=Oikopleura dioica TaxID=34765 RepID=A0ABN7SF87_OIKDI|nr:Oidioi.mRNA.OKI2018_I69.XSR.g13425.t1.cds [Oikopleura dioica]
MKLLVSLLSAVTRGAILVGDYPFQPTITQNGQQIFFASPFKLGIRTSIFHNLTFLPKAYSMTGSTSNPICEDTGLNSTSQTLQSDYGHKIVMAPFMGDFQTSGAPSVHYSTFVDGFFRAGVEATIRTQTEWESFSLENAFSATWVDVVGPDGAKKTFQVALVSNNVQTFSVFSYHNGPPSWTEDDAGQTPFVGILAHEGHSNGCFKTVLGEKDVPYGSSMIWDASNYLECTDSRSFTECGELEVGSTQYETTLVYKSISPSLHSFDAVASCLEGFTTDAAGNTDFSVSCAYDPDFYESIWTVPINPSTSSEYSCNDNSAKVQITLTDQQLAVDSSDPLAFLFSIDPSTLSARAATIWELLLEVMIEDLVAKELSIDVSVHVTDVNIATSVSVASGEGRLPVRKRRAVANFSAISTALSAAGESFQSFEDIEEYLIAEAEAAGAYPSDVATISYTLGFENGDTTNEQIQETVVTVIQKMHDPSVTESTLSGSIPDFSEQSSAELSESEVSISCLGKGTVPSQPNPLWVKPDICCGNKPIASTVRGCCHNSNGKARDFVLAEEKCCHGEVVSKTTLC